jgi:uncharacterized protein with HEPN domain
MSRHDDAVRLRHMLDHAIEAVEMCRGCQRADLDKDRKLNLALVRLIEIIGEAATRVTEAKQSALTGIPWPEIIGMRNRIVHGYDQINFDILWAVIQNDLPPLIRQLRSELGD